MSHFKLILIAIVALILQTTLFDLFSLWDAKPDLLFIIALFIAFMSFDTDRILISAWILGLVKDFGSTSGFGAFSLIFLAGAFAILRIREFIPQGSQISRLAVIAIAAFLENFTYATLALSKAIGFWVVLGRSGLMAIYTALLFLVLNRALVKLGLVYYK